MSLTLSYNYLFDPKSGISKDLLNHIGTLMKPELGSATFKTDWYAAVNSQNGLSILIRDEIQIDEEYQSFIFPINNLVNKYLQAHNLLSWVRESYIVQIYGTNLTRVRIPPDPLALGYPEIHIQLNKGIKRARQCFSLC